MKRHPALAHLSSDHHDALRLARSLQDASRDGESAAKRALQRLAEQWRGELLGHFAWEERWFGRLLGDAPEAAQLLAEHWALRQHIEALVDGKVDRHIGDRLGHVGALLQAHVRWEERVLMPVVERAASDTDLAQMQHSTKHPPSAY